MVTVLNTTSLKEGHLVAVTCENCDLEPLIARVTNLHGSEIDVVWLEGSYSKPWHIARQRDPANRRKMVDWTDTLPRESILLFAFELTSSKHLRKPTISHLKNTYSMIRNEHAN